MWTLCCKLYVQKFRYRLGEERQFCSFGSDGKMPCGRQDLKIISRGLQIDLSHNLSLRMPILSSPRAFFESSLLIMFLVSSIEVVPRVTCLWSKERVRVILRLFPFPIYFLLFTPNFLSLWLCLRKGHAELGQVWIFGIFYWKNSFGNEIEWHHNFSRFLRARKFPVEARHNRAKFGTSLKSGYRVTACKKCLHFLIYVRFAVTPLPLIQ